MIEDFRGWVLYDGSCGLCSGWIPFWEGTLRKRGFAIAPLQSEWVRARLGVSDEELAEDLRLLRPGGEQVLGADVYRVVMRRIRWALPFWVVSNLPVCRGIFVWTYLGRLVDRSTTRPSWTIRCPVREAVLDR